MTDAKRGLLYALTAYTLWGGFALFFYLMRHLPATEVLAHRILWSLLFVSLILSLRARWHLVRTALRNRPLLVRLFCSSLLIAGNWGLYIWAAGHGQVLEASLGYYITPLVNILLALLVLRERLDHPQQIGLVLACIGVGYSLFGLGTLPWVALALGGLFGCYGLIRKQTAVDNLTGLFLETLLLAPLALAYALWLWHNGQSHFLPDRNGLLLLCAGVFTALPLLAFAAAAQRLSLTVLGFVTYLTPTLQLLTAVLVLGEQLTRTRMITFGFIWAGLLVVSLGAVQRGRRLPSPEQAR